MNKNDAKVLLYIDDIPHRIPANEVAGYGIGRAWISPDDLPNLRGSYGDQQGTTIYGNDVLEEKAAVFNGGYVRPSKFSVQSPVLADYQILLCDQQTTPRTIVPYNMVRDNEMAIPFHSIYASLHNSAIAPNLLVPSASDGGNPYRFQFIGNEPLHYHLKGSVKISVRVSQSQTDRTLTRDAMNGLISPRLTMLMVAEDIIPADNASRLTMAVSDGLCAKPMKFNGRREHIHPGLSYAEIKEYLGEHPAKDLSYVRGSIPWMSIDPGYGVNSTPHLMTDWFDIGSETKLFLDNDKGATKTLRIQWVLDDGRIVFDNTNSLPLNENETPFSSQRIVDIPHNAVACRIWFKNADKSPDYQPNQLIVKPLPSSIDPYAGVWTEYHLNIDLMGVFHPEKHYGMRFIISDYENTNVDTRGFLIDSSHLTLQLNVRDELQLILNNLVPAESGET